MNGVEKSGAQVHRTAGAMLTRAVAGLTALAGSLLFVGPASTAPSALQTFKDCPTCAEMLVVPAGSFTMGQSAEVSRREPELDEYIKWQLPEHTVRMPSFALAKYPVTRGEYAVFVRETQHQAGNCILTTWDGKESGHVPSAGANWQRPSYKQTDRDPVVCLSWSDANAYVNWLAAKTGKPYRMPTEAEMEYATRAGTTTSRYWGDSQEEQCKWLNGADATVVAAFPGGGYSDEIDYANGHVVDCSDGFIQTSPVGSFPPNPWGFYDILGNAFTWTADCWNNDYNGAPTDGSAWTTGLCAQHVIRGGSWYFHPGAPHSSFRHPSGAGGSRQEFIGIRVARSLP